MFATLKASTDDIPEDITNEDNSDTISDGFLQKYRKSSDADTENVYPPVQEKIYFKL